MDYISSIGHVYRNEFMQLITQHALIPGTPSRAWLSVPYYAWEWKEESVVDRPTENAALRRIFKQARLYSKSVIPMLTPTHQYAMELERHYMGEFKHWDMARIRLEMAKKMHVTEKKVKAILEHADVVCELYETFGWGDMLN